MLVRNIYIYMFSPFTLWQGQRDGELNCGASILHIYMLLTEPVRARRENDKSESSQIVYAMMMDLMKMQRLRTVCRSHSRTIIANAIHIYTFIFLPRALKRILKQNSNSFTNCTDDSRVLAQPFVCTEHTQEQRRKW